MCRKLILLACLAGALVPGMLAIPGTASAADETFAPINAIPIPKLAGNPDKGLGSFDIGFVDPFAGVYILADRSNSAVDVVNLSNDITVARQLTGCGLAPCPASPPPGQAPFTGHKGSANSGPNGVITANDQKEVWAGDGDSTTKVLDIKTGILLHNIPMVDPTTKKNGTARADELCEDPRNHLVLMANDEPADIFISFISTSSYSVVDAIKFDGNDMAHNAHGIKATNGIEQCQWSPRTGKFYLNIPEVNGAGNNTSPGAVLQIDPVSRQVDAVYSIPLADCAGPQGMAVGPDHQILLGCSNAGPGSAIIDERTGGVLSPLAGLNGSDEVWYNFGDNQYTLAESNHTGGPILGVVDPSGNADASATSVTGSHSVAAEPFTNHVYVPVNNTTAAAAAKACSKANAGVPDADGCVLIFGATGKDDKCAERGAPVLAFDPDGPHFLRIEDCRRGDRDDRDHDR
jgi:hypothetical protein